MTGSAMLLTGIGVVFLLMGLAIAWYGLRPLVILPRLIGATVAAPVDIETPGEFVVCRGTATETTQALTAPFTGRPSLGFEVEVTERQPFGIGLPWSHVTLDDGVGTAQFSLTDTGTAIDVDPASRRFSLDTESTTITVGGAESPPERIARFCDRREIPSPPRWLAAIPWMGHRRYIERSITPGESYVVAGRVTESDDGLVLAGDLCISDRSRRRLIRHRLWQAAFPLVVAVVFIGVGIVALSL